MVERRSSVAQDRQGDVGAARSEEVHGCQRLALTRVAETLTSVVWVHHSDSRIPCWLGDLGPGSAARSFSGSRSGSRSFGASRDLGAGHLPSASASGSIAMIASGRAEYLQHPVPDTGSGHGLPMAAGTATETEMEMACPMAVDSVGKLRPHVIRARRSSLGDGRQARRSAINSRGRGSSVRRRSSIDLVLHPHELGRL